MKDLAIDRIHISEMALSRSLYSDGDVRVEELHALVMCCVRPVVFIP